jgi:alpha-amylase
MPWGDRAIEPGAGLPRDEGMRAWYKRLIAIRRDHPSLRGGEREGLEFGQDHFVFMRRDAAGGDPLLVAVNRAAETVTATVTLPEGWPAAKHTDLIAGATFAPAQGALEVEIPARGMLILAPAE